MRWLKSLLGLNPSANARKSPRQPARTPLGVEGLEERSLLDATPAQKYVTQVFRDLLRREPDGGGLNNFTTLLNRNVPHSRVVGLVAASTEFRNLQIRDLYQQYLKRAADAGGQRHFVEFVARGGTYEQVAALLVSSGEYYARVGGTPEAFITTLFQDALGRNVDPVGLAGFTTIINGGANPTAVAHGVLLSLEYRQNLVRNAFLQFLHRPADQGGLDFFVGQFAKGARDEDVLAGIVGSQEYIALAAPPTPPIITAAEVSALLDRASAASPSNDAIIAVLDRGGRPLGIRVEDGVSPAVTGNQANLVFAIDGAMAKARTGAFFANNGGSGTPLTSRTVQFISQTTVTQRMVESNPNIQDINSTVRGPGFVSPIGIKGHFPPGVPFTPQVDLFQIEGTNRDSLKHPGQDRVKGTADDIQLPNRFNVPDADIPASIPVEQRITPPESYGVFSGLMPDAQGRGVGTLPGGIPIFRKEANGQFTLLGGIGVFFPGTTGYASEENSALSAIFDPNKRDRSLEAEFIAVAALNGTSALPQTQVGALGGVAPVQGIDLPFGRIDLVGITLDVIGPGGDQGVQNLLNFARTLGSPAATPNGRNMQLLNAGPDGKWNTGDEVADADNLRDGIPVPEGWLVGPKAGVGITAAEVERSINQGIAEANATRAAIRLPLGTRTRMVLAVTDKTGDVVGLFRMPDSTIFSIDVAVAKARNVSYYDDPAKILDVDRLPGIAPGTAFTNRTFRYLALPRFPEGIDTAPPGPFSVLNDGGVNLNTALNVGAPLPASAYQSVQGFDAFNPGTNFHAPNSVFKTANQNGIVFFPGSAPLYKDVTGDRIPDLIGGVGISGDGVDQDDVVTAAAALGFGVPSNVLRADQVTFRGVALPYQKFNRNPGGE